MKQSRANQNLREWVEKHGLSQSEIVQKTGLAQSTVSQHLSGDRCLSQVSSILRYSKLGIPLEDLLPEQEVAKT